MKKTKQQKRKQHFISGLDRSGSTLLAAIFLQNPRFYASDRSPLLDIILRVVRGASGDVAPMLPQKRTAKIIRGMFDSYYDDVAPNAEVVFDTERGWTLHDSMLDELYPEHKMILCVRDIVDILNSFEHIHKKNPFVFHRMMPETAQMTTAGRIHALMSADFQMMPNGQVSQMGQVFRPLQAMSQYLSNPKNKPLIIEYEDLVKNPNDTMRRVYDFLGEEYFQHDFERVGFSNKEHDTSLLVDGLHDVRDKVKKDEKPMILPDEIVKLYKNPEKPIEFWREKKK